MKKTLLSIIAFAITGVAHAIPTTIDFEDLAAGTDISGAGIDTGDNIVTFSTGTNALIAQTGGRVQGFVASDTPNGADFGQRFLTDETSFSDRRPRLDGEGDYFMSFSKAIFSLSLDAADYRRDGGGRVGDVVSLQVFAADMMTLLGMDSYVITGREVDGYVHRFSVLSDGLIRYASLTSSGRDVGTGIDNVTFSTVPEPGTLGLLGLGLLAMGIARRRAST